MFAPCGVNCTVCYKHLGKKPCPGCRGEDDAKPAHCRKCRIKYCVEEKGLAHCLACEQFPCKYIRALDKSYRARYGASPVANGLDVGEHGVQAFMARQRQAYRCPACGGVLSLQDGVCSGCAVEYPPGRRGAQR